MKNYLVNIFLHPMLRTINRTPSSLRAGSGAGTDSALHKAWKTAKSARSIRTHGVSPS